MADKTFSRLGGFLKFVEVGIVTKYYNLNTLQIDVEGDKVLFPDGHGYAYNDSELTNVFSSVEEFADQIGTWKQEGQGSGSVSNVFNGFIDYNDTTGAFNITADTWSDIPNNGLGAFTNKNFPPTGVTELLDTSTGYIDTTQLDLGDNILIRNDFNINPNTNNALLKFRYELGGSGNTYTLEKTVGRLDSGSGQDYRFSLTPDLIYMGDTNTKDNPIKLQVYCTSNAIVTNAGSVITVVKR